jgi:hypothetical protein
MHQEKRRNAAAAGGRRSKPGQTHWAVAPALALTAALAWPGAGLALAQDIQNLGKFGDWRAYAYDEKGEKACYIASQPEKNEGEYKKRGEIYAMVTHRPADKVRDEVSLAAGYRYKTETRVKVSVDGKTFELFPHEDTAWVPDSAGDRKLVAAMRAGKTMVVLGTSSRGTATKDTYSLLGFTKAYQAASKACGY